MTIIIDNPKTCDTMVAKPKHRPKTAKTEPIQIIAPPMKTGVIVPQLLEIFTRCLVEMRLLEIQNTQEER